MIKKRCPFCCNENESAIIDTGGACCFCDYEGVVTIGLGGMFSNIKQYNEIYYSSNHKEMIDKLHDRKNYTEKELI